MLLLGPSAISKTHLAVAVCREAIVGGYTVLFVPATALVATPAKARADGRLDGKLTQHAKPKLLIVDELGYLPFEPDAAHLFHQLVSRRYESGSLLATLNRTVGKWDTVFGDLVVITATIDRILQQAYSPSTAKVAASEQDNIDVQPGMKVVSSLSGLWGSS